MSAVVDFWTCIHQHLIWQWTFYVLLIMEKALQIIIVHDKDYVYKGICTCSKGKEHEEKVDERKWVNQHMVEKRRIKHKSVKEKCYAKEKWIKEEKLKVKWYAKKLGNKIDYPCTNKSFI
eukprot:384311_1